MYHTLLITRFKSAITSLQHRKSSGHGKLKTSNLNSTS